MKRLSVPGVRAASRRGMFSNDFVSVFQQGIGLDDVSLPERRELLEGGRVVMEQRFRLRDGSPVVPRWRR